LKTDGFSDEENKLDVEGVARCRFFLQGVKDLRISNESSEEFVYRHDSNTFTDRPIPYKLMSSILY
jgi:hypothetical protein